MHKKITVCLITRGYIDYVAGLANALSKLCKVYVYLSKRDEIESSVFNDNVNIRCLGADRVRNIPQNIFFLRRLFKDIKKISPDIIHYQSGVLWELLLLTFFPKTLHVMTVHDVIRHPDERGWRGLTPALLKYGPKKTDRIVVHGEFLKQQAMSEYNINPGKIDIIPHGMIERYGFCSGEISVKNNNILFFGNVDVYKGVEYLIEAEKIIRKKGLNINIIIAGSSPNPEKYKSLVTNAQSINLVLRQQTEEEVTKLFKWADILVLPYIEASQSGVLQIGISNAVPSVVSDVGSLGEVIKNEQNGLLVPPKEPVLLAKAIIRLLNDVDLRKKIIGNIHRDRELYYKWGKIAEQTTAMYKKLIFNSMDFY